MKTFIVFATLLFSGCSNHVMTNDEIIAEVKKCESAGLVAERLIYMGSGYVAAVICKPKDSP